VSTGPQLSVRSIVRNLLDFLYPPTCQICRKTFESTDENIWLCPACRAQLQLLPSPLCPVCRTALPDPERGCSACRRRAQYRWLYALSIYDDRFSHLVKAFKYENREELGTYLGRLLGEQLRSFPQSADIEVVCAVPIHPQKEHRRGFSQTAIIAAAVAEQLGVACAPGQLRQVRRNRDQIGLTVEERFRNVREVFAVAEPFDLYGKYVLLIDDVTTSGATLNAAAFVLKQAGARQVAAATLAMALEDGVDPAELHALLPEDF